MADIQEMAGGALIAAGAFFYVVGALGLYRMPDVFTRMHAVGISDTVGVGLLLTGMMFLAGFSLVTVKLAIILGIILFTSPIATHALAQAALHEGIVPMGVGTEVLLGPGARRRDRKKTKGARKARAAKRRKRS
ncbi:MAG: monovalent cation/H(+) antiporter subunit G [Proteobacteria bacterium]|nr:monovalent cation/H(+) antiporter subunit G [Pseudomonadota bacterium]